MAFEISIKIHSGITVYASLHFVKKFFQRKSVNFDSKKLITALINLSFVSKEQSLNLSWIVPNTPKSEGAKSGEYKG